MGKDDSKGMNLEEEISKLKEQLEKTDKEAKINDSAARFAIFAGHIPSLVGIGILATLGMYLGLDAGAVVGIEKGSIGIEDVNKYYMIPMVMIGSGLATSVANALAMCYLERKAKQNGQKYD